MQEISNPTEHTACLKQQESSMRISDRYIQEISNPTEHTPCLKPQEARMEGDFVKIAF